MSIEIIDVSHMSDDAIRVGLYHLAPCLLSRTQKRRWVEQKMVYVRKGFSVKVSHCYRIQRKTKQEFTS